MEPERGEGGRYGHTQVARPLEQEVLAFQVLFFPWGRGGRPSLSSRPSSGQHPKIQSNPIASLLPAPAPHTSLLTHQPPSELLSCIAPIAAHCLLSGPRLLFPYLLQWTAPLSWDSHYPKTQPYLFGAQEAEDEKSVLMAAVQSGGEEANLLLPELGSAFYDMAR